VLPEEQLVVLLNFSDAAAQVWVPFARAGRWHERIDGVTVLDIGSDDQWTQVVVPSNYGAVYALG
jgi:hypothetical protein